MDYDKIIKASVERTLAEKFKEKLGDKVKKVLTEMAVILTPKTFVLKTESLSSKTKEIHMNLYKKYVDSFNKVSGKLDVADKTDANNANNSTYRALKLDETHNMNGAKLHELYFSNIGDPNSEIRTSSLPYLRLARDWGTFDAWQFDFRACGMCATEGWVILGYDPYKQRYFNYFVEKHTNNMPLGIVPVIVIDTWHHAWFLDFPDNKTEYLNSMLRELNWSVVEARMILAERSNLHHLYSIMPIVNTEPEKILGNLADNQAPIGQDQVVKDETAGQVQPPNGAPRPYQTPASPVDTNPRPQSPLFL